MKFCPLITKTLLLVMMFSFSAYANKDQQSWPDKLVFDGIEFEPYQIERAFLSSVFSDEILNKANESLNLGMSSLYKAEEGDFLSRRVLKSEYPWLYPHIYPDRGLPKLMAVNKWVHPIRISFGMPNDGQSFLSPDKRSSKARAIDSRYSIRSSEDFLESSQFQEIWKGVSANFESLSQSTGLDIRFISKEDISKGSWSNVRINFRDDPEENSYDLEAAGFGEKNFVSMRSLQTTYMKTGFKFTSESERQVEGYILSNHKNEIEMAVCYLSKEHSPEMLKNLLSECIIRSLGFPSGFSWAIARDTNLPKSYIGFWNDQQKWSGEKSMLRNVIEELEPLPTLSEFDMYLIQTLYNPKIKPGMDYIQVQEILWGR